MGTQCCVGSGRVKTVVASVLDMPVSTQMGHSYTSYTHTDHMLGTIRRLRAELSNLFTPRPPKGSVDSVKNCTNVNCPSKPKSDKNVIFQPAGIYSGNAGKTALTRRKSCSVEASNIVSSRPWHSSQHKKTTSEYPAQRTIHPKPRPRLHSTPSFSLSQTQLPSHRQLSRRHSEMGVLRRLESWQERPRVSFLNPDAAGDDLEEHNEAARSMWRHNVERRKKVHSFRHQGVQQDLSSFISSNYSAQEHIYEEIAEAENDCDDTTADSDSKDTTADSDSENDSFFTLISSGRRNNLRFYGDA